MNRRYPLPVDIRTYHEKKSRMDIYYPVIQGFNNHKANFKINREIMDTVYGLNREQGYHDNPNMEITGDFEIKTNERGILSFSIINYAYSGGAHGMTIIRSITSNSKTGEMYQLSDLFKKGSNYVEVLTGMVQRQIDEREITLLEEFVKINPQQDFYIADKSLVLYFQLYEITPYAFGFPYFPISIYDIQEIINNDGPLGILIQS